MISDNEFTYDPMFQPSMDVMWHNYIVGYNRCVCKCGKEWWEKKGNVIFDKCVKCRYLDKSEEKES